MATKELWHEARTTSFWHGTLTSWCGQTVRRRDVQTRWFGCFTNCRACRKAKKDHKRGGSR